MTQYHKQDIAHNARKFPNVSQVSVKYHKNMIKMIIKQASLKIIVAILAKKLVLYCRCSLKAYFKNCKYFFILIIITCKTLRLHLPMVHFLLWHLLRPCFQINISMSFVLFLDHFLLQFLLVVKSLLLYIW